MGGSALGRHDGSAQSWHAKACSAYTVMNSPILQSMAGSGELSHILFSTVTSFSPTLSSPQLLRRAKTPPGAAAAEAALGLVDSAGAAALPCLGLLAAGTDAACTDAVDASDTAAAEGCCRRVPLLAPTSEACLVRPLGVGAETGPATAVQDMLAMWDMVRTYFKHTCQILHAICMVPLQSMQA